MKTAVQSILIFCLISLSAYGQSWVIPDSSFENCQSSDSCVTWEMVAGFPRNIQVLSPNPDYGVPNNIYGTEPAAHGSHYMKIVAAGRNFYREYIGAHIGTPLAPGNKVAVSFSISKAENCKWACNNMGIAFWNGPWVIPGAYPSNGPDSIRVPNVVYQENGWYQYSDTFTLSTFCDRITIGNHRSAAETTIDTAGTCGVDAAIYYVDALTINIIPNLSSVSPSLSRNMKYHHSTDIYGNKASRSHPGPRVDWYTNGNEWEYRKVIQ